MDFVLTKWGDNSQLEARLEDQPPCGTRVRAHPAAAAYVIMYSPIRAWSSQ